MSQIQPKKGSLIGATLLIAGTCIGGGMLATPISTGIAGFWPSMALMLSIWVFMTLSGLLLGEVSLWFEGEAHFISMAEKFLGPVGKWVSWILYLFIGYASLVAYASAGGHEIFERVNSLIPWFQLGKEHVIFLFLLSFGSVIAFGDQITGRVNEIFFFVMIGSYFVLISLGVGEINEENLRISNWSNFYLGAPLMLTAFSYQVVVPSITLYLDHDAKRLRKSIVFGTTLALVVYVIWQFIVIGIVSQDQLMQAMREGVPVTVFLREATGNTWSAIAAEMFAFFALVTSFFGIALGLSDFLADGFKIEKKGKNQFFIALLMGVPVYFFAVYFERAFLIAMDLTGGIGDSILSGIFPVLMFYLGIKKFRFETPLKSMFNIFVLVAVFLFFMATFIFEILSLLGFVALPCMA